MPYLWQVYVGVMDDRTKKTRNRLKRIVKVKDFDDLINQTMLDEEERKIMDMIYKEKKSLSCIADELGMAEITVKKKHGKILKKMSDMF